MGPGLNMPIRQVKARETINVIAFSRKKKSKGNMEISGKHVQQSIQFQSIFL
jgi:hypothetical protein